MTKVVYILADGTQTTSYAKAQASGQRYTVRYEPVDPEPIKMTDKRRAMRVKATAKQPIPQNKNDDTECAGSPAPLFFERPARGRFTASRANLPLYHTRQILSSTFYIKN